MNSFAAMPCIGIMPKISLLIGNAPLLSKTVRNPPGLVKLAEKCYELVA